MKPKTISVKLNRKINLGNYESIDCDVFIAADIDEDEDIVGVAVYLGQQAKEAISEIFKGETDKKPFVNVQPMFMNKPIKNDIDDKPF